MAHKMLTASSGSFNLALLIFRAGFGLMYVVHGYPKITGGVETWTWLGGAMSVIGINFAPVFWGFMAAIAEFVGGILLFLGVLTRPVAAMMLFTMLIATLMHVGAGDPINSVLHPLKGLVVFAGLILTGAGRYSVDSMLAR